MKGAEGVARSPFHSILARDGLTLPFLFSLFSDFLFHHNQPVSYLPNPGFCHVVLTCPETKPCMLFLFVVSSFCTQASFGRSLAIPPLPLASTFANDFTLTGFKYRGLSPHKFTPVPGVHNRMNRIASLAGHSRLCACWAPGRSNDNNEISVD